MDDSQSVTDREDDLFKTRVLRQMVVESTQSESLFILVVGVVDDMPVPQGVVRNEPAAYGYKRIDKVDIGAVFTLVGIYKNKVKKSVL